MADATKTIALLSNVTVDLIVKKMNREYSFYLPDGFDTWVQEIANPEAGLYSQNLDAVIVLLDGTEARSWKNIEEGSQRIELWKQALRALVNNFATIPIFVSTIDVRENRIKSLSERKQKYDIECDWYHFAQELVEDNGNVFVFDLNSVISDIGRNHFYSNKMWYMSSMPYSLEGLNAVVHEIGRLLRAAFTVRKKIVVLDLDNTLWGGVIGEDGIDGIELSSHKEGERYFDFQRQLLEMKNRGIVLAINSKNNHEDVEKVIESHPAMLLHSKDFVCKMINWDNKAVNMKRLERELNLTESGFIFIDDNPVERETIAGECPETLVPEFPTDTTELLSFAENLWFDYCRPLRVLVEDVQRTQMYQNEIRRNQDLKNSITLDDYIAKLEIVLDIHKMKLNELARVTQLVNKTNQFNVTTRRYTLDEIEKMGEDPSYTIYVVYSSDKYGDSGLISVIILKEEMHDVLIDTFLMSCRVMGRKIENVIINEIIAKCKKKIIAEYIPTSKNIPVNQLYDQLGFSLISERDGHKLYELDPAEFKKQDCYVFKKISFTC